MILRALGVILTMLMGYVLTRSNYKLNGFFTMVVFIPMIFNGGMISSYVVNTQLLNLKNSIWSLILPLCVSSFNVVICKTFFKTNIPESVIESAQIDGDTTCNRLEECCSRCHSYCGRAQCIVYIGVDGCRCLKDRTACSL